MTVEGGIGRIPEALAARLDVRTGHPAVDLELGEQGMNVKTPEGEFEAGHVILATPAHTARESLGSSATPAETELLAATYSSTINLSLGLADGYRMPDALHDVYGFLIPARERQHIAAVTVERNKSPDRTGAGELLAVFLAGDAAERLQGHSDTDILTAIIPELEHYLPDVESAVTMTHLIRWPAAEPRSPIGRSRAVAAYQRAPRPDLRLLLAGDYVGLPWTDGAAETGEWAAAKLIQHLTSATS